MKAKRLSKDMDSRGASESGAHLLWSPDEEEDIRQGTEEQRDEQFPGLNKAHGFFYMIKKNQRDRDSYHQEREEWKQARKKQMERNERGPRQRPPLALYRPPHQRSGQRNDGTMSSHQPQRRMDQQQGIDQQQQGIDQQQQGIDQQQQTLLYQLEVELRPDFWRQVSVVCGEEEELVAELAAKYQLSPAISCALLHHMIEFKQTHFSTR